MFRCAGRHVHNEVGIRFGLIGVEVSNRTTAAELDGTPPPERGITYLVPDGRELGIHWANR
ncbi:MAG TPA: hypothetical protein VHV82_22955 [Sporichthyaceae bacterium]|nr:hypothetical protein [Sporichthyaceae bacterium]